MKYDKYRALDWDKIQKDYDNGMSWRNLGYTFACLNWGVANGKLKTRGASETMKLKYATGQIDLSPWKTEEFRKKCSKNGGVKKNAGRCKSIRYISPIAGEVFLNGTWEYKYALWLDENSVKWKRNTTSFPYEYKGKTRNYYPDFYLVEDDKYVEIKGYETEKDRAKWTQFNKSLLVLKRKELTSNPYNFNLR